MPVYLVETYLAAGSAGERAARERRARTTADELTRAGTPVRFAGSMHIPEDEICVFKIAAESAHTAELAAQRAELDPLRVVEVFAGPDFDNDQPPAHQENR